MLILKTDISVVSEIGIAFCFHFYFFAQMHLGKACIHLFPIPSSCELNCCVDWTLSQLVAVSFRRQRGIRITINISIIKATAIGHAQPDLSIHYGPLLQCVVSPLKSSVGIFIHLVN